MAPVYKVQYTLILFLSTPFIVVLRVAKVTRSPLYIEIFTNNWPFSTKLNYFGRSSVKLQNIVNP